MKKVIFLFGLFFLLILNANAKEFVDRYTIDVYANGFKDNTFYSYKAVYKEHQGVPVYCLDFGVTISVEKGYNTYELSESNNYTTHQKEYIEIISFFGYRYGNHDNIYYYLATQELIWGTLGVDVYWSYSLNGGDYLDLSSYKHEILDLYAQYINENNNTYENHFFEVGNTYKIYDTSTSLPQYQYTYVGVNDVYQNARELTIYGYYSNVDTLILTRNYSRGYTSKIFIEPGYQSIIKPGNLKPKTRTIEIVVEDTSIKINRVNISQKDNKNLRLDYAMYEIYDQYGNFYRRVSTNILGELIITNIPLGKYKIIEVLPSYGFERYGAEINIDLIWGNTPVEDTIYIKPIKKEVTITNIYKINNVEYKDSGIMFEVHNEDGLETIIETDSNGFASVNLEYGKYKFIQVNSREGFEVEPVFEVEINDMYNELDFIFIKEKNIQEEPIEKETIKEDEEINDIDETTNIEYEEINNIEYENIVIDNLEKLPQLYEKGNNLYYENCYCNCVIDYRYSFNNFIFL